MQSQANEFIINYGEDALVHRSKVLRQTYILLSGTILFSALCAFGGMQLNVSTPWLLDLVMILGLAFGVQAFRNSGIGILLLFAFTGYIGFSLASTLNIIVSTGAGASIVKALIGAGIIFMSLSFYVLKTGKDFTFLGGFLFTGLITGLLLLVAALLFQMPILHVALSGLFLLIFSGYVLYDTSNIVQGYETNYITATLQLFIDIYMIFVHLLQLILAFGDN